MANNPRYPHQCRIYRISEATSFNPEGTGVEELYFGECRMSSSVNIRTFDSGVISTGKVDTADYRVSIPGLIKSLLKGDSIDVTNLTGDTISMRIVTINGSYLSEYKKTGSSGEMITVQGGTELLCKSSSN